MNDDISSEIDTDWRNLARLYPALAGLPPDERARLQRALVRIDVPAGNVVFRERDACAGFPLVVLGCVRIAKIGENGREIALYRVRAGGACIVSTSCLLGAQSYRAFAVTEEFSRIVLIPPDSFEALLRHPEFRRFVFHFFAERVVSLMTMVESLAFHRLDQRMAAALLEHAPEWRVSQQALADDLGSVREIVGRHLKHFSDLGWVEMTRGRIRILAPEGLRKLAKGDANLCDETGAAAPSGGAPKGDVLF